MKAAVLKDVNVLEVDDVPEPGTGHDQIKVKIAYCGICGTDPEAIAGRFDLGLRPEWAIGASRPRGWRGGYPRIMGHEASGTIAEIGKDIRGDFKVGQKVAMNFKSSCGACYYCNNRMEHFCEMTRGNSGAMAEYAVYYENTVFPLPEDVPLDIAAFVEPLAVALHSVDIGQMKVGDSVIIAGGGSIGLLTLQLAIRAGASKILVSEPVAEKRKMAKELGADVAVDPINEDLLEASDKLTDGRGFNVCFEVSGKPDVARQLVFLAENCGTIVWTSVYPSDVEVGIPPFYLYQKELSIRSVQISPYSFYRSVSMLSKLNLKPLITVYPLDKAVEAYEAHGQGKGIKILIKP
ncbi:zinc-binding dehydrogenase [Chloroflexota bacterium]